MLDEWTLRHKSRVPPNARRLTDLAIRLIKVNRRVRAKRKPLLLCGHAYFPKTSPISLAHFQQLGAAGGVPIVLAAKSVERATRRAEAGDGLYFPKNGDGAARFARAAQHGAGRPPSRQFSPAAIPQAAKI